MSSVPEMRQLSTEIADTRVMRRLTQTELSFAAEVHERTLRRIEGCWRLPEARTVEAIARVLDPTSTSKWLELLRAAKRRVRRAGGIDAFKQPDAGVLE